MSINILDTVKNYFTPEFTNQASTNLDEHSSGIAKALSAIIPASLAGILNKVRPGGDGANNIFEMAKNAAGYLTPSPNLTELHDGERGSSMISNIFGNNQTGIIGAISKFAGIKDSSTASLMRLGLPATMGILGKHVQENNLSASGFSDFLSSQKNNIMQAMPPGLSSVAGMLGLGALGTTAASMASNVKSSVSDTTDVIEKRGGAKWLLPLILILLVIGLLWYFSRSCNQSVENPVAPSDTGTTTTTTDTSANANMGTVTTTAAESIKVKLPDGKELEAYKGGIEDQLVAFLSSDWKSLSDDSLKNRWFNFDNLNFNTGTATLKPESEKQLDNIAEILKAFPDAKIKIGGYTDVTGDAATNKKLSEDRANAAKNGLVKRGVGKQVTGAEGYGSQFAKYPATATEEERASDRHVSVSVRK